MKVCIRTDGIDSYNPFEAVKIARNMGINHFEFRYLWGKRIPSLNEAQRKKLLQFVEEQDVDVVAISPPLYHVVEPTEKIFREQYNEMLPQSINLAKELGANLMICFSFNKNDEVKDDWVIEKFRKTAEVAEREGITLALEPDEGEYADSGESLARIVKGVDSKFLGVNWDPANIVWCGHKDYPEAFRLVKKYIRHVHLKDVKFEKDGRRGFVPIGEGIINFKAQLEELKEANYEGYLSIEAERPPPPPNVIASEEYPYVNVNWCRQCWENLKRLMLDLKEKPE